MHSRILQLSMLCVCMLLSYSWLAEACSSYTIQTNNGMTTHTYWTRTMDLLIDSRRRGAACRSCCATHSGKRKRSVGQALCGF